LHEAEKIVQVVADKLDPEANIIWGTQIDESLQNVVRTTVVVSGIESNNGSVDEPDFDDAEDVAESEAASDQLDSFIDGIF
jgi:cell division protein FtsZ